MSALAPRTARPRHHAVRALARTAVALGLTCAAGTGLALTASPAHAAANAIVGISGSTLVVAAPQDGPNSLQVALGADIVLVRDLAVQPVPGNGCTAGPAIDMVTCPRTGLTGFNIVVAGGADRVVLGDLGIPGTVDGGVGDDVFTGGAGTETFVGGPGRDIVTYNQSTAGVVVTLDGVANDGVPGENDQVSDDIEYVDGSDHDDVLIGSDRPETFIGSDGDDRIDGGLGKDLLAGNDGFDTVTYQTRTAPVSVTVGNNPINGEAGEQDIVNVEVERVIGGSAGDTLIGNDIDNVLIGGAGDDTLTGGAGNDTLQGGTGADTHTGGLGADCVSYVERTAKVVAKIGISSSNGEAGELDSISSDTECLLGGAGDDQLTGDSGVNTLEGRGGNDVLDGGLGADVLVGGTGRDQVTYLARNASVTADLDNVADDGEAGEGDRITASVEQLVGGSADDKLTGSAAKNLLSGGGGNDTLNGLGGADNLVGGSGVDTVTYAGRATSVTVTINAAANDGAVGEGDRVATDVENLIGGNAADTLTGSAKANTLTGGAGGGTLHGSTVPAATTPCSAASAGTPSPAATATTPPPGARAPTPAVPRPGRPARAEPFDRPSGRPPRGDGRSEGFDVTDQRVAGVLDRDADERLDRRRHRLAGRTTRQRVADVGVDPGPTVTQVGEHPALGVLDALDRADLDETVLLPAGALDPGGQRDADLHDAVVRRAHPTGLLGDRVDLVEAVHPLLGLGEVVDVREDLLDRCGDLDAVLHDARHKPTVSADFIRSAHRCHHGRAAGFERPIFG
nr:calcium-binding protein [Nocardioides stalactiti]